MENDFLTDSLMLYIEKDIASTFSLDLIVDDFGENPLREIIAASLQRNYFSL